MFKNLQNIIKTPTGKLVVAVILGVGLATLFRRSCEEKACIKFKAPNPAEITANAYKHGELCYKFVPVTKECTSRAPVAH